MNFQSEDESKFLKNHSKEDHITVGKVEDRKAQSTLSTAKKEVIRRGTQLRDFIIPTTKTSILSKRNFTTTITQVC
jgi:hypothetical protein